jgi:hypothetical protein
LLLLVLLLFTDPTGLAQFLWTSLLPANLRARLPLPMAKDVPCLLLLLHLELVLQTSEGRGQGEEEEEEEERRREGALPHLRDSNMLGKPSCQLSN